MSEEPDDENNDDEPEVLPGGEIAPDRLDRFQYKEDDMVGITIEKGDAEEESLPADEE